MSASIGVIGIGRMGAAICARLVHGGFEVAATDRRPEREAEADSAGARWMTDTATLVSAVDVLITVLPGSDELGVAVTTALPALRAGMTWIDMTTATPRLGRQLMQAAEDRGSDGLVATIGGGIDDAHAGTLQLFVGGDVRVLDRHRALLQRLGSVEHVGDHAAGYLTKLVVNFLWFAQGVALGEAIVLAAREGVELDALIGAIGRSAAGGELVRNHGPALLRGDYVASYGLDRCCEQLRSVVDHAAELGVPTELAATVQGAYRDALGRYGPVDGELLAVARLEERAGVRLHEQARIPSGGGRERRR